MSIQDPYEKRAWDLLAQAAKDPDGLDGRCNRLTPVESMQLLILNDERNVRDVSRMGLIDQRARVIANCAARLFQAREVDAVFGGGGELGRKAEINLRNALIGWSDR